MRNLYILIFFLLSGEIYSQSTDSISVQFNDEPLNEALSKLGEIAGKQIFFIQDWTASKRVTADFTNAKLNLILDELFEDTLLNYFELDNAIVITENAVIHDNFDRSFYNDTIGESKNIVKTKNINKPIFYEQEGQRSISTYKIGKENSNSKNSYTLTGFVTDKKTGEKLSNVAILVEGESSGTATDENGYYQINLSPGTHLLSTQSLGNLEQFKRVVIYNNGELNFQLEENLEQLNEVLVESASDRNVKEAFAGVNQIDVQAIKTIPLVLGERDILKVATTLPGISKAGEGSSGFNVRGGREDQNLILLDNGLIYNPNHFFGIFSALNPFTTGSVEIYKGTIPAKFGGRLSSVFDIKTKKGNPRELSGEGSIGPVTGNLALEIPIIKEKSSLIVGGRATYSDWILRSLDEESLKNSEASFYDIVAKYNHQLSEDSELNITGYFSKDRFSITSDSLYSYKNLMFSAEYEKNFNNDLSGSVLLTNSKYDFNIEYDSPFADSFLSGFGINDTQIKFNFVHRLNKDHELNYGLSSKLYTINPGNLEPLGAESQITRQSLSQEKGLESALYLSDEFDVTEKFVINGGLRFSIFNSLGPDTVNYYEDGVPRTTNSVIGSEQFSKNDFIKTYSGLEYRLAMRYSIFDDFSVKAGYASTLQYIHKLSNNTTVSPTDIYKLSDFNIEPQRATQYSLGFFKNLKDNEYELSLEGYYKTSSNILDFKTGATLFLNENIETETLQGEGKSYGAEVLVRKNTGRLNGWLSYAYSRSFLKLDSPFVSQRVNNGNFFPSNYDKPHDFAAVMNYKVTQRFSFSANLVYQTGRPVTVPIGKYDFNNSEYVAYSDRNQYRIPDYYRLDLSFNAEGNHRNDKLAHSFWNISIYNVLGRNNPYSVYFVTDNGEVKAYQSSIFSIPVPTITYNFKF